MPLPKLVPRRENDDDISSTGAGRAGTSSTNSGASTMSVDLLVVLAGSGIIILILVLCWVRRFYMLKSRCRNKDVLPLADMRFRERDWEPCWKQQSRDYARPRVWTMTGPEFSHEGRQSKANIARADDFERNSIPVNMADIYNLVNTYVQTPSSSLTHEPENMWNVSPRDNDLAPVMLEDYLGNVLPIPYLSCKDLEVNMPIHSE